MSGRHINVQSLSDEELAQTLRQHGVSCGPIIEQTRGVYQKKLANLLKDQNILRDKAGNTDEVDYEDEDYEEEYDEEFDSSEVEEDVEPLHESRTSGVGSVHQKPRRELPSEDDQQKRFPRWLIVLFLAIVVGLIVAVLSNMEPSYSQPALGSDSARKGTK